MRRLTKPKLTRIIFAFGSVAILGLGFLACTPKDQYSLPRGFEFLKKPTLVGNRHIGVVKAGDGIACYVNGSIGRASYAISEIGKGEVPHLSASDTATLHTILRFVHPDNLRYAHVHRWNGKGFILFEAPAAVLCDPITPPFFVLNGACNEYYTPLTAVDSTMAAPDCDLPPRPWIKGDSGRGTGCSWSLDSGSSCG